MISASRGGRPRKTLAELERSGTFRHCRHWDLLPTEDPAEEIRREIRAWLRRGWGSRTLQDRCGMTPDGFDNGPLKWRHKLAKQAWKEHGEAATAEHVEQDPGTRPAAWWVYASPEPRDESVDESVQLHRMGELTDDELDRIRQQSGHICTHRVAFRKLMGWQNEWGR